MPRNKSITRLCENCGKTFSVKPYLISRGHGRFCSWSCFRASKPEIHERFWSKVDKNAPIHPIIGTRCWVWTSNMDDEGYGLFSVSEKSMRAHVFAYQEAHGYLLPGFLVLHHCDNPPCVRESHMFVGTHVDNMIDCGEKGRLPQAKLTPDAVRLIRKLNTEGASQREIGRRVGTSHTNVGYVLRGELWSWVP